MPDWSHPRSAVDLFGDEDPFVLAAPAPFSGLRLPDGRTLAWGEYGNPRGLPCLLIPDLGSSRLSPGWLLHDTAVPASIRLLAVDRPGVGASDPVGIGGRENLADDLMRMVQTLAVGRIAVIGIGSGADDALAFANRHPDAVTAVIGVSARISSEMPDLGGFRHRLGHRHHPWYGPLLAWERSAGRADLTYEPTWRRALGRMESNAAETVGERWREPDFRSAVATDLALGAIARRLPAPRQPAWVENWSSGVPVRFWHGRHEAATHYSAVRAVANRRPDWQVTTVAGCSALLGSWPDMLQHAEESFGITRQMDEPAAFAPV